MKLKTKNIILFFILFILFIDARFMGLIVIPDFLYNFMGSTSKFLVAIFSILLALYCFMKCHNSRVFRNKYINRYFLALFLSILFIFIVTLFIYDAQPAKATFRWAIQYIVPILFFPIAIYLNKSNDASSLFKHLNRFVLLYDIIFIIQAFLYNSFGMVFLEEFVDSNSVRDGMLRMAITPLNSLMIFFNLEQIFNFKNRRKERFINGLLLFVQIFSIVYVQRSRALIIIIAACCFIYILSTLKNKKTFLLSSCVILVCVLFVVNSPYVSQLINSFFGEEYSFSTMARAYAYSYYFQIFKENPFWGIGFARNDAYYYLIHGSKGIAVLDDVGFVGQMASLGIFAFIIYLPIIFRLLYIYKKTRNRFILAVFLYILFTSFSLICLDPQRIILVPFVFAISEYYLSDFEKTSNMEKS